MTAVRHCDVMKQDWSVPSMLTDQILVTLRTVTCYMVISLEVQEPDIARRHYETLTLASAHAEQKKR